MGATSGGLEKLSSLTGIARAQPHAQGLFQAAEGAFSAAAFSKGAAEGRFIYIRALQSYCRRVGGGDRLGCFRFLAGGPRGSHLLLDTPLGRPTCKWSARAARRIRGGLGGESSTRANRAADRGRAG